MVEEEQVFIETPPISPVSFAALKEESNNRLISKIQNNDEAEDMDIDELGVDAFQGCIIL